MNSIIKPMLPFFMLLLSACEATTQIAPKEPLWGREPCARCRMILSDKRFAVQRISKSGEVHFYDDLNCALSHRHTDEGGTLYVRPYGGETWIPAETAKYVGGLMTPMASGFGAVTEGGNMTFADIKERFKK